MAYNVIKATLGFEPIEKNPSYDYTFPQNQSYDVTNSCKTFLGSKKLITIDSSKNSFGYDVHDFASSEIDTIKSNPSFSANSQVKLIIQMHDNEDNKVYIFVFIRDKGWVIRDQTGTKIEFSKSPEEQIMISQNGYHSISSGKDAADVATTIADLFNLSPMQKAALVAIAKKSGTNTSSLIAKAIELAKNKAPFAFAEASIRFDRTVSDEATKQLQICLIRIAGGNLESERKHLRGANYPISSDRWRAAYGPIFAKGKADNGLYIGDTQDAIRQLKPFIDSIQPGLIKDDAMEVKSSILTSPVCAGLIGDVTAEERKNSRSKTPMPVPVANQQKVPEIADVPKPTPTAPTAPAAKPTPAAAPASPPPIRIPEFYSSLSQYRAFYDFIIGQNDRKLTNFMNNVNARLQQILSNLKKAKDKPSVLNELTKYIQELNDEKSWVPLISNEHITKAKALIYAIQDRIRATTIPESKIYKDYGFLSTKNEKLHSVLMEQLKKDLKRG